jgi:hypothetical protein
MKASASNRFDRFDALAVSILLVVIPIVFGPLLHHLIHGTDTLAPYTDYPAHNAFAAQMRQERRVTMPHPLYHFVVIGMKRLLSTRIDLQPEPNAKVAIADAGKEMQGVALAELNNRYATASLVALLIFLCWLSLILWREVRRAVGIAHIVGALFAVPLVIALMLVAPVSLLHSWDGDYYLGYIGINVWHSPTVIAAKPLALMTFLAVSMLLQRGCVGPVTEKPAAIKSLAETVILGALAKPSFLLCLLPASLIVAGFLGWIRKRPVAWRALLLGVVLPAMIVLAWQSHMYKELTGGSHAKFSPLTTMASMSDHLTPGMAIIKLGLSVLFPVVCYLLCGTDARRRFRLNFAWVIFFFGLFLTYFIAESRRTAHGNFLWSAQLGLFVLFVESTLCVIASARERWPRNQERVSTITRVGVCALAFALHLGFGLMYYVHLLTTPSTTPLPFR